jgi:hypothetical protein
MILNTNKVREYRWRFRNAHNYVVAKDKTIINSRTNRIVSEVVKGGYTKGYNIGAIFIKTSDVRKHLEPIPNIDIPF